jgi:hypothetical protein
MIHDECYHLIDYYVIDLLTERSEQKYNKTYSFRLFG